MKKNKAARFNDDKVPMEILPFDALWEVGRVLLFGQRKYSKNNWRKGLSRTETIGSALRHISKWLSGSDFDKESGLHHLSHAACNILFALAYCKNDSGEDDRFKIISCDNEFDKTYGTMNEPEKKLNQDNSNE